MKPHHPKQNTLGKSGSLATKPSSSFCLTPADMVSIVAWIMSWSKFHLNPHEESTCTKFQHVSSGHTMDHIVIRPPLMGAYWQYGCMGLLLPGRLQGSEGANLFQAEHSCAPPLFYMASLFILVPHGSQIVWCCLTGSLGLSSGLTREDSSWLYHTNSNVQDFLDQAFPNCYFQVSTLMEERIS